MKRRLITIGLAAAAAALLAACETTPTYPVAPRPATPQPPPPPPPPPTPAEEFAWSTHRGANDLTVVVNYQPAAGQAWSCGGLIEALMPETSYSRRRIAALYGSAERAVRRVSDVVGRSKSVGGDDYGQYVKQAACDGDNTVSFRDLPNGAYFVIARVRQTRPAGANGDMVIMQRVELAGGQTARIVIPQGGRSAPPSRRAR